MHLGRARIHEHDRGAGARQTVSHHDTIVAGVNGAMLGFASFFFASTLGERLAKYTKVMIAIGVITVLLAIAGGFLFAAMYQSVHA